MFKKYKAIKKGSTNMIRILLAALFGFAHGAAKQCYKNGKK